MILTSPSDIDRFWVKVDKTSPDDCWLWTAAIVRKYGMFSVLIDGKRYMKKAHRIAYELIRGAIPNEWPLDHTCHHEACVNPAHLRPVTVKQNAENRLGANRNSKSGVRGVHWNSATQQWVVVVVHHGKNVIGGYFNSVAEAAPVAQALRSRLFTHNDTAAP